MNIWKRTSSTSPSVAEPKADNSTGSSDVQANSPATERWPQIIWTGKDTFRIGHTEFLLSNDSTYSIESTRHRFVLLKNIYQLDFFARHAPAKVDNIVDLGIYRGGSIALYNALFSPKRIVGVDLIDKRVSALDKYVSTHSLTDRIKLYYGTDQGDHAALSMIMGDNFGEEALDLVIDDASHMYQHTKASFNELFPRLRPGGVYVIEDWGWAHWDNPYYQGSHHIFSDEETPLSKFVLELVMVNASRPGFIDEIHVRPANVYLVRGREAVPPGIDIASTYLSSGRQILH
jgi:SAM-dependent methyltransferase